MILKNEGEYVILVVEKWNVCPPSHGNKIEYQQVLWVYYDKFRQLKQNMIKVFKLMMFNCRSKIMKKRTKEKKYFKRIVRSGVLELPSRIKENICSKKFQFEIKLISIIWDNNTKENALNARE